MSDLVQLNSLNVHNDLLWLKKIVDLRLDPTLNYADRLPFIFKLKFVINSSVKSTPISWKNWDGNYKIVQGVHLYEEDCSTVLSNNQGLYAFTLDSTPIIQVLTQRDDFFFIKVNAFYCEQKGTSYTCDQSIGTPLTGWVKKEETDLPDGYNDNITPSEFEAIVHHLPEERKADGWNDLEGLSRQFLMREILHDKNVQCISPPDLKHDGSPYAGIILENDLGFNDRLLLILALAPHVSPILLEDSFMKNGERVNKLSGGVKGTSSGIFLPTGQTFIFLSSVNDLQWRLKITHWLLHESILVRAGVLSIQTVQMGEQFLSGAIVIHEYYIQLLLTTKSQITSPQAQVTS